MCVCVQVSQLTCALTPAVRPSLSACSITGRSCRVTPKTPRPNPSRSWARHANARAWRRAFPHLTTSWTNYNRSATSLFCSPTSTLYSFLPSCTHFLPSEFSRGTVQGTNTTCYHILTGNSSGLCKSNKENK